jgi:hypothetical protein
MISQYDYKNLIDHQKEGNILTPAELEDVRQYEAVEAERQEIIEAISEAWNDESTRDQPFGNFLDASADAILRLLGGVIDPDQTWPENPLENTYSGCIEADVAFNNGYFQAQSDMIAAGWKRVISLEEK